MCLVFYILMLNLFLIYIYESLDMKRISSSLYEHLGTATEIYG